MSKRQTRSQARECAFILVFQIGTGEEDIEFLTEQLLELKPESVDNLQYIRGAYLGTLEKLDEIDGKISAALPENRGFARISKVVKTILRLAVYEIFYVEDVPEKVAINEAVELAKKYAEDDAPAFINGVLSGVIK